VNENVMLWCL